MKYFVLAGNALSLPQRNVISNYISNGGYGYWHWFPDFWLVTTMNDNETAGTLRDNIRTVAPLAEFMIFAVRPSEDWAGYGNQEWAEWLRQNWGKWVGP